MAEFKYGLKELRFISDPGHGWLEVPTADVEASGYIQSQYSYVTTETEGRVLYGPPGMWTIGCGMGITGVFRLGPEQTPGCVHPAAFPNGCTCLCHGGPSWTYLEEDCDVAGFVQALGVAPELVAPTVGYISYYDRTDSDSWVRDLPHCSGQGFVSPFRRV